MKLTKNQLDAVAKYLGDISKLVFAAAVLGFFAPIGSQPITLGIFAGGIVATLLSFWYSIKLTE